MKYNAKNLIPIYNMEKAFFYIEHGVRPVDCQPRINCKTKSVFFLFEKDKTSKLYTLWKNNKR